MTEKVLNSISSSCEYDDSEVLYFNIMHTFAIIFIGCDRKFDRLEQLLKVGIFPVEGGEEAAPRLIST